MSDNTQNGSEIEIECIQEGYVGDVIAVLVLVSCIPILIFSARKYFSRLNQVVLEINR